MEEIRPYHKWDQTPWIFKHKISALGPGFLRVLQALDVGHGLPLNAQWASRPITHERKAKLNLVFKAALFRLEIYSVRVMLGPRSAELPRSRAMVWYYGAPECRLDEGQQH